MLNSVLSEKGERTGIFAQLLEVPQGKHAHEFDLGDEDNQAEDDSAEDDSAGDDSADDDQADDDQADDDQADDDQAEDESRTQDLSKEGKESEEGKSSGQEPTKEDDKQYEKEKRAEGKDPDKPNASGSGEGQAIYTNQKPTKKPILKHGNEKLDLRKNRLFRRFAQMIPTGLAILDKEAEAM